MLDSNFWQDKSNSQKVIKEKKLYEEIVKLYDSSIKNLKDLDELNKLAIDEENIDIQKEVHINIEYREDLT